MKILETCIELGSNVKLYMPSTMNVDQSYNTESELREAQDLFCSLFGGATTTNAYGIWKSESGQSVKEGITLLISYCTEKQLHEGIGQIVEFCRSLKVRLKQESIALEVNNKLYLI